MYVYVYVCMHVCMYVCDHLVLMGSKRVANALASHACVLSFSRRLSSLWASVCIFIDRKHHEISFPKSSTKLRQPRKLRIASPARDCG